MNAAHTMQLRRFEKRIGFQSNGRPVRVSAKPDVCVAMTATSVQTPKMSASRRQVTNGRAEESAIRGNVGACAVNGYRDGPVGLDWTAGRDGCHDAWSGAGSTMRV